MEAAVAPSTGGEARGGASAVEQRPVMVFFRDTERGLGFSYKTPGIWRGGVFDAAPWKVGRYRCDCARGTLLYSTGEFACGSDRFPIERIVVWDTGVTVYSECGLS